MNFGMTSHLDGLAVSIKAMIVPSSSPTMIAKNDISKVNSKPFNKESIYSGVLNNSPILVKNSLIGKTHVFNYKTVNFGKAISVFYEHFGKDFIKGV